MELPYRGLVLYPKMRKVFLWYLVVVVAAAHLAWATRGFWAVRYLEITPGRVFAKAVEVLGVSREPVRRGLVPLPSFAEHRMDGRLRSEHPRIVLRELEGWSGLGISPVIEGRKQAFLNQGVKPYKICGRRDIGDLIACWVSAGDFEAGRQALARLDSFRVKPPRAHGDYGNAWKYALAADLLSVHPEMSRPIRERVARRLRKALDGHLRILDGDSASLWHGRATLAATAWIVAAAMDPVDRRDMEMVRRAQGHFLGLVRALSLVEAWPEGYSYWINNRAFLVGLAGSAYLQALENSGLAPEVRETLRRVGLWHVYATRPDHRAQGLGDEGPRVDLKDETRPVIDLIAGITGEPALATYSRYLEELHSQASYYSAYRWLFWLINDPTIRPLPGTESGRMDALVDYLPRAEVFGRGAMNQVYIRSGWGPKDTFISFRAGHSFTHHGHYDAGHFTLFKGGALAIDSSTYADFTGPHRLYYGIRTVAKNSLLVLRPGEGVHNSPRFEESVADGGQRPVLPSGSAIRSVAHFRENLGAGMHLEGGELLGFENVSGSHVYVAADLTAAYNNLHHDEGGQGGKVASVLRELFYLYGQDRIIVHDQVESNKPGYTKKWLLHTLEKPIVHDARVSVGTARNGILETSEDAALVRTGEAYLQVQVLKPLDPVIRLVGGPDYRFYVEIDGDDRQLDGKNFEIGASSEPWFDQGLWRMEVQPSTARRTDSFLVVMSPSIGNPRRQRARRLDVREGIGEALLIDNEAVVFSRTRKNEPLALTLPREVRRVYVAGFLPQASVEVRVASETRVAVAGDGGVVTLDGLNEGRELKLQVTFR